MGTCFRFSCTTMAARYSTFVAVVALYALSFHGSCTSSEAKAESKAPATDPSTNILRVDLIHRDSPISPLVDGRNLSNVERLHRAIERSHNRWRRFQHYTSQNVQSHYNPVNYNDEDSEYFMQMTIGSPVPLKLHFMIDTGSDLIWTQCQPCSSCAAQNDPMYNPFQSSSYKNVSCSSHSCLVMNATSGDCSCDLQEICTYGYGYVDGTVISGVLAEETFRFVTASSSNHKSISHLSFGCVRVQTGGVPVTPGIIGLGRGPLSLVSQMGSSIDNIFSYCLGSIYNVSQISPLFLGGRAAPFRAGFSATPLIQDNCATSYCVGLDGISVDDKLVPIPKGTFELSANGSGVIVIDSGTAVTHLEEPLYMHFLDAVRLSITAQPIDASDMTGLDLCYYFKPGLLFPNITFHFAGGADYVLPPENSFIVYQQEIVGFVCLAFSKSPVSSSHSLFGNFQQQNFHIVYDLGYNTLSFAPANCASI